MRSDIDQDYVTVLDHQLKGHEVAQVDGDLLQASKIAWNLIKSQRWVMEV